MSSSADSSTPDRRSQSGFVVPNLYIPDPSDSLEDLELPSSSWMVATVIEDDDLMFGGKPLCAWYEEDRRRLSSESVVDEEETRGRQRERVYVDTHSHQKAHRHHHQQRHHHQCNPSDTPKTDKE
ncbi:hypothetical protein VTJ04DRAFT_2006 [Mycothermus thermophilus]|uniref:uncharacterized protein n=1 Tax=Humicola insolens TaxID=85995 RepID=UPI003742E8D4